MKKQIALILLCSLFTFVTPAESQEEPPSRGLFVTVIQDPPVLSSREEILKLIDFAKSVHIKTLFVQIYYANKAWFPSKVGDSGPYEACLKSLNEDPFALLIKEAHASGIQVHAWLNMLSLGNNEEAFLLKKYGPDILTRNRKKKDKLQDYKIDNQYFLEPGDLRVREELLNMVDEILRAYPGLDGIQFDYIRYPDEHPFYGYTKNNMDRFKKATGRETVEEPDKLWKDWKRAQVTELLELLVKKIRAIRPGIQISTTGCMPCSRAYLEAFQDWPGWLKRGLVDFVTIMTYTPNPPEFKKWITAAMNAAGDFKKVNIAIGAYKMARLPRAFAWEFELCERSDCNACVVFHYESLVKNTALVRSLCGPPPQASRGFADRGTENKAKKSRPIIKTDEDVVVGTM